ncbi:hypothetical protein Xtri_13010 [Xanthomonas campestris pv. trichodesmae]|nr:hypothetical protein [Xanthomonas campestris pv. trichodesmae]MBZ3923326.1 hypothetical protein [Xanthomonas citri pv. sesbaniae]
MGYSFSTWRLHLCGENIRSARDVGWVRNLSAGKMRRKDANHTAHDTSVAEFPAAVPVGFHATHGAGRCTRTLCRRGAAGRAACRQRAAGRTARDYAKHRDAALLANTDIVAIMKVFDTPQADELAVIDSDRKVLGVLREGLVRKRYAEELKKRGRELMGERAVSDD